MLTPDKEKQISRNQENHPKIDQEIQQNTFYYLENYLNPNKKWNRSVSLKKQLNLIRYSKVNWKIVSEYIKNMKYTDFLQTPYWKIIATHSKFKAKFKCQICNNHRNLETHHRSYSMHGFEHTYMHDLVVLCGDCHSMFHRKNSKSKPLEKPLEKINLIGPTKCFIVIVTFLLLVLIFFFNSQPSTKLDSQLPKKTDPSLLLNTTENYKKIPCNKHKRHRHYKKDTTTDRTNRTKRKHLFSKSHS